MRLAAFHSRRPTERLILCLGMLLGLLQVGLGLAWLAGLLDGLLCVALGALLDVVISTLAGFFVTRLGDGRRRAGSRAGCMVGLISFLMLTIAACIGFSLALTPVPSFRAGAPPWLIVFLIVEVNCFAIAFPAALGVAVAALGGWIGGRLAERKAQVPPPHPLYHGVQKE